MFSIKCFRCKTVLLLLLIISVIVMVTSTVAFANEKQYKEQNRSGSVPQLVTNDTHPSTVNACVRVNSQYMFGGRLEEYFTDPENDPITFWVKQDNGSYSQNLITTITDGNDTYTSFIYTPTTVETTTFEVAASDNNGTTFSSPITVNLTVCAANSSEIITTTVNYPSGITNFSIKTIHLLFNIFLNITKLCFVFYIYICYIITIKICNFFTISKYIIIHI